MHQGQLWDIFCTVIDNHGDLGVCWRLARQLREAGEQVRLWVDDASALAWMAPEVAQGQSSGIEVRPWAQASDASTLATLAPAAVWIEAFGCALPEAFVAHGVATRAQPPLWINLEYLSAEDWVPRMHSLPSPVMSGPAKGWTKHFVYPGFTAGTGGLLREAGLSARQQAFDRPARRAQQLAALGPAALSRHRWISLFCYEPAGLAQLLAQLASSADDLLLVTPGRPLAAVQQALKGLAQPPHWQALPYCAQDDFDALLWACDLNFVRGEDSLVRALWAGQPFVWHIYPQDDHAHHAKLEAFLDWLQAPSSLRQCHRVWNGIKAGPLPTLDAPTLADWAACVQAARARALAQADLCTQLLARARLSCTAP